MTWLSDILAEEAARPLTPLLTLTSASWANDERWCAGPTLTSRGDLYSHVPFDWRFPGAGLEGLTSGRLRVACSPSRARLFASATAPIFATLELVYADDPDTVVYPYPSMRVGSPRVDDLAIEAELTAHRIAGLRFRLADFVPSLFPGARA